MSHDLITILRRVAVKAMPFRARVGRLRLMFNLTDRSMNDDQKLLQVSNLA